MNVLDLFSGSKSLKAPVLDRGWNYFSVDVIPELEPDLVRDILLLNASDIPFRPDIIWASPPCTTFSIASVGTHWNKDRTPKTNKAVIGLALLEKTIDIIQEFSPYRFYIENPRGMMRKQKIMNQFRRATVTYCQYGDERMKPTDIWTNDFAWQPRPMCSNGDLCHVSAPRGSRTGTQGCKNNYERSRVPRELLDEILDSANPLVYQKKVQSNMWEFINA